jgi:hypothetical protein
MVSAPSLGTPPGGRSESVAIVRNLVTGRAVLGGVFVVGAAAASSLWLFDRSGELWARVLARIGVFALFPTFADLRAYTAAWECDRAGLDVVVSNPCDPWSRVVTPKLPVELSFLGLGESSTVPLAIVLIAAFLVSVLVVSGPLRWFEVPLYAAIVFSPSVLLGIERANTDLLMFTLLTVVLVTVRAEGPLRAVAYAALLLAAMFKLYPIFAFGVLLRQGRRRAVEAIAAVLVPFALYIVLIHDQVTALRESMHAFAALSWGATVLPMEYGIFGRDANRLAAVGLVVGLVVSVAFALVLRRRAAPMEAGSDRTLDAFWIGAGVYVGAFATAANHNYKLVFLLFVLPQLLAWLRRPEVPFAEFAIVGTIVMFWIGVEAPVLPFGIGAHLIWIRQVWFPVDEALGWALFAYLATALLLTLPRGLVDRTHRPKKADTGRAALGRV